MTDFETHHIATQGDVTEALLRDLGVDINSAYNTLDLPVEEFADLPGHGFRGNHSFVGYTEGVQKAKG
jgi:hypothetical protein